IFFNQCESAHCEATLWEERAKNKPQQSSTTSSLAFARLLPTFPISSVLSSDIRNASTRITRSSIANPKLASILSTLSKPYGSVREIVEPRKPHSDRILIYVQD